MRQLLLLRHAKSAWDEPGLPDRERPLNQRGQQAAAMMRDAMHRLGLEPDMVLVSPARRTLQTLEALEPWEDTPLIEQIEALYLATPAQILGALHAIPETVRSVLVIGHNPGLHDLAQELASGSAGGEALRRMRESFPTAALAEFTVPGSWLQLHAGSGRLIRFLTPRELERSA